MNLFKKAIPVPPKVFILDPDSLTVTEHKVLNREKITGCHAPVYTIEPRAPRRHASGRRVIVGATIGLNRQALLSGYYQVLVNRKDAAQQRYLESKEKLKKLMVNYSRLQKESDA